MRVIIAGGSGLIGRELVKACAAKGYETIVLSRNPKKVKGLPENARAVEWDGKTVGAWGALVDGAKAVITLAGAGIADQRWTQAYKDLVISSRVDTANALVDAIAQAEHKPSAFLVGGAVGIYGDRGTETITEDSTLATSTTDLLAVSQKALEDAAERAEAYTRVIYMRSGPVFTTKGGALEKMLIPFKLFVGGALGSGKQYMSWIHIDDEVKAIVWLMETEGVSGIYNLVTPEPGTNKEVVQAIGKAMGRPAFTAAPSFALKLALGEMSSTVLTGQKVLPTRLLDGGFEFDWPHAVPAMRDLIYNEK